MSIQHNRKVQRKTRRCQSIIEQDTGIKCKDTEELNLVICNAGLSTGLNPESVLEEIGNIGKVSGIIMLPGKSFCFLSCFTIEDSKRIFNELHGKAKLGQNQGVVYLSFCSNLPSVENPWDRNITPQGLIVLKDFVTEQEESVMMKCIDWSEEGQSSGKELKHRQVKHFGYEFRYGTNDVDARHPLAEKIPKECNILWKRMSQNYPEIDWPTPDQLTVNKYAPGQGIPPHCDTHSAFIGPIVSLSLGSDIVMEFKSAFGENSCILLPRRSLLLMTKESRYNWTHAITPRCMDIVPSGSENATLTILKRSTRLSFTFRKLRRGECDCSFSVFCDTKKRQREKQENSLELANMASRVEEENVHRIYNEIAQHFSETRHSPWPRVAEFIGNLPTGSSLVDIGCGNGKYLLAREDIVKIGCDRSKGLLQVCHQRQLNAFLCDCLAVPVRDNSVSACISIAVIHHLASEERRVQAVSEMARILEKSGRGLIYVWAKNQEADMKKSSYLRQNKKANKKSSAEHPDNSIRDENLPLPVHTNRTQFQHRDILVPWKLKDGSDNPRTFLRYYHVFEEGELEELCRKVGGIRVLESYYDQGNWCVIFEKIFIHTESLLMPKNCTTAS